MNDRERIIDAVCAEVLDCGNVPLTAALVDLSLVAVCPVCRQRGVTGGYFEDDDMQQWKDCTHPYHAHLTIIREKGLSE